MQAIQRTSCPDRHHASAAYLAAMIDQRTRTRVLSTATFGEEPGAAGAGTRSPAGSALIWVEGGAEPARTVRVGRRRGMIVVAHESGQGDPDGSFIISFPVDADDHAQHVAAISGVLKTMGWSMRNAQWGRTFGSMVSTAALISTRRGAARRLWLAEPVSTAGALSGGGQSLTIRDQLEAWVNEGGAGDDVSS